MITKYLSSECVWWLQTNAIISHTIAAQAKQSIEMAHYKNYKVNSYCFRALLKRTPYSTIQVLIYGEFEQLKCGTVKPLRVTGETFVSILWPLCGTEVRRCFYKKKKRILGQDLKMWSLIVQWKFLIMSVYAATITKLIRVASCGLYHSQRNALLCHQARNASFSRKFVNRSLQCNNWCTVSLTQSKRFNFKIVKSTKWNIFHSSCDDDLSLKQVKTVTYSTCMDVARGDIFSTEFVSNWTLCYIFYLISSFYKVNICKPLHAVSYASCLQARTTSRKREHFFGCLLQAEQAINK